MSGIGSTISQAISGAPQSIASGEGIFGSLAHAVSPTTGGIYDDLTKVAGLALMSGLGSGGGGGIGSLFGGGGQPAMSIPTSMSGIGQGLGAPAGTLAGQPYYSADQYASYGPNAPNSASFAAPVGSPPAALSPAGGGAMSAPALGNLSPSGGGPSVPAPPLGGTTGGAPGQYYFNGQSWVQNPAAASSQAPTSTQLAAQDSASVGNSYLQYLQALNLQKYRPTFAPAHNSAVGAPMYNPLAPAGPGGITPPQLVV